MERMAIANIAGAENIEAEVFDINELYASEGDGYVYSDNEEDGENQNNNEMNDWVNRMVGECQLRDLKIRSIQVHRYIYVARVTAYLNRHAGKYNRRIELTI